MTYVVGGMALVIVLLGGAGYFEYRHIEKLDQRLGSAETTITTLSTALKGIQDAQRSRNTTDRTVRELAPDALIDKLR